MDKPPPPDWGGDVLTQFADQSRENIFGTFFNLKSQFLALADMDKSLVEAMTTHPYPPSFEVSCTLMMKCISALRAAALLAAAGQISEAQVLIRNMLEWAVYGSCLKFQTELISVWKNREENSEARRQCQDRFKYGVLIRENIEPRDERLAKDLRDAYQRSIDLGAHPNVGAMRTIRSEGERLKIDVIFLTGNGEEILAALRDVAAAAILCLKVWQLTVAASRE